MSPRRIFGELALLLGVVGGSIVGYCAGQQFQNPEIQTVCAFAGMALGGAFIDICMRGGK